MGVDATILFAAETLELERIAEIAKRTFASGPASHIVVLLTSENDGPKFIKPVLPHYSAISVWADDDLDPQPFAVEISRILQLKIVAITLADHACLGGWQAIDNGHLGNWRWLSAENEDNYTDCGVEGIETILNVSLNSTSDERLFLVENLLDAKTGICIRSETAAMQTGCRLSNQAIQQILEYDLPDASLECLLMLDEYV